MLIKRIIFITSLITASISLAACANKPQVVQKKHDSESNAGKVLRVLKTVSLQSEKSTKKLANAHDMMANAASSPEQQKQAMYQETVVPARTGQIVNTLNFDGSAETAAKMVAAILKYRFNVIGNPPAAPITVSLHYTNTPAYTIIQSINAQVGSAATLTINPKANLIQFTYNN